MSDFLTAEDIDALLGVSSDDRCDIDGENEVDDVDGELREHMEQKNKFDKMLDVKVKVDVVLGDVNMKLGDLLKLNKGVVVALDKYPNEYVHIVVNDKVVAKGEVIVLDDKLAVRIREL